MSVICVERNIFLNCNFLIKILNLLGFVAYVFIIYICLWMEFEYVLTRLDKIYCEYMSLCNTCEGLLFC